MGDRAEAELVAQLFHEAYERLAPSFGYETRKASAVPWESVPEPNRSLMVAVAGSVLDEIAGSIPLLAELEAQRRRAADAEREMASLEVELAAYRQALEARQRLDEAELRAHSAQPEPLADGR